MHQVGVSFHLYYDARKHKIKNTELYSKNKFEKLVYLVGFIIRIFQDARSPEFQIHAQRYNYISHTEEYAASFKIDALSVHRQARHHKQNCKVKQSRYRPGVAQRVPEC